MLATLTDTVIEIDRRYLGHMRRADREAYYEESKRMAAAFGVPEDLVPPDYAAFRSYFADKVATLQPTAASREITRELMGPRIRGVPGFAWLPFNLVTTELLPARMRRELHLRDLNAMELATVRTAQLSTRNSIAHVPNIALGQIPFFSAPQRRAA